jgi:hypothetical protein
MIGVKWSHCTRQHHFYGSIGGNGYAFIIFWFARAFHDAGMVLNCPAHFFHHGHRCFSYRLNGEEENINGIIPPTKGKPALWLYKYRSRGFRLHRQSCKKRQCGKGGETVRNPCPLQLWVFPTASSTLFFANFFWQLAHFCNSTGIVGNRSDASIASCMAVVAIMPAAAMATPH